MTPERWKQIDQLAQQAISLAPRERVAFLSEACADDDSLRRQVESLLAYQQDASGFLSAPAFEQHAELFAAPSESLEGKMLGHYQLRRRIGSGGMGEVYLAHDNSLDRQVAIKLVPSSALLDGEAQKRLIREARAAAKLDHPNICAIYEVCEEGGQSFIVMQYIEGETLDDRIRRGPLTLGEALRIGVQVAEAIVEAHSHGIIHRDIKPQNIMLTSSGHVRVLDFGLAKLVRPQLSVDSEALTATLLSKPGMIVGTMPYMSPEQVRGEKLDARTDVFSFGVVLYQLLSGRQPFAADSAAETISAILTHEPPLLGSPTENKQTDEVGSIVDRALRKDREQRYQTARDLLGDLKNLKHRLEFEAELERTTTPELKSAATTNGAQITVQTAPEPATRSKVSESKSHKPAALAAFIILSLAFGGLGIWYFSNRSANTIQINSIAVLPFINESGNPDAEYLSDGMTETLINSLSQLPNLSVKARNTVFRLKGKDTIAAARELNVQAVLTGRVVQRGDELTLFLELIDAATENQIWGKQYNRKPTNLVLLQTEIAQDVSDNLKAKLTGAEKQKLAKNYTQNAEAYQLYLRGRFHWNKRTIKELEKSIEYFQQAVAVDPKYALGYAGLADAYSQRSQFGNEAPREMMPKAKDAALEALRLDNRLAEAHAALGLILAVYDHDFGGAESELRQAIELNPGFGTAHHYYGRVLSAQGKHEEALTEIHRALEIDPLALPFNWIYGISLYQARKYDEAIAQLKKTEELDANFTGAQYYLTEVYWAKGDYALHVEETAKLYELDGNPEVAALMRETFAKGGWQRYLRARLERPRLNSYTKASIYAAVGEKDKAFAELNKLYEKRSSIAMFVKVDPRLDPLRGDPRFAELLRRVNLVP